MEGNIIGTTIGVFIPNGEGKHRVDQTFYGVHCATVIRIGDDIALLGNESRKGVEGMLHISKILEKVQMIRLNIEDHSHCGEEIKK